MTVGQEAVRVVEVLVKAMAAGGALAAAVLLGRCGLLRRRGGALGVGRLGSPVLGGVRRVVARLREAARAREKSAAPVVGIGASLLAGVAVGLLLGGAVGVVGGGLVAGAAYRWLPELPTPGERAERRERAAVAEQLPLTADLLAACLAVGGGAADAVAAVAAAVGPPLGPRLAAVAAELRLGGDPAECWARFGVEGAAPLGRCLERACRSGAPPSAVLARLAETRRAAASSAAQARVRRVGVLATVPLGLCFLPAFVLTGVVPTVAGLTSGFFQRL